jgi:hypothetical protein
MYKPQWPDSPSALAATASFQGNAQRARHALAAAYTSVASERHYTISTFASAKNRPALGFRSRHRRF